MLLQKLLKERVKNRKMRVCEQEQKMLNRPSPEKPQNKEIYIVMGVQTLCFYQFFAERGAYLAALRVLLPTLCSEIFPGTHRGHYGVLGIVPGSGL